MDLSYLLSLALLIFGFGFVIFWHELGHFLAAKWAGVKVEQFAVGFGQALVSYRKGMGVQLGSSGRAYAQMIGENTEPSPDAAVATPIPPAPGGVGVAIADVTTPAHASVPLTRGASRPNVSDVGETEYRLNWVPLGGYVKMLGQDDLDPTGAVHDPRSYTAQPVGKRMVIISAGVIMNILLAVLLFTILFGIGFKTPPAVVGYVEPMSPAQRAGLGVGDRILTINGRTQHDFNKVGMNVALSGRDGRLTMDVLGRDGTTRQVTVDPRPSETNQGFPTLGILPGRRLTGLPGTTTLREDLDPTLLPPDALAVRPGETIVAVDGRPVGPDEYPAFDDALQASGGEAVEITVRSAAGAERVERVRGQFAGAFGTRSVEFAGMQPQARIESIDPRSSAIGKLRPGDVVLAVVNERTLDVTRPLTVERLSEVLRRAGDDGFAVSLEVSREGQVVTVEGLAATLRLPDGRRGLGIGLTADADGATVGGVRAASPAALSGLPEGATLVSVGGQAVASWHDVRRALGSRNVGEVEIVTRTRSGQEATHAMELSASDVGAIASMRYRHGLMLGDLIEPRQTNNPLVAAWWGVTETRDMISQFYLVLRRMVTGEIAASNAQGPLGIVHVGSIISHRGTDWLLWFLAMISANLAVVNFLPIPILDGGHFAFLLLEKVTGRPPGPRLVAAAQVFGLILLASVFLFVTYNDIQRLAFF